MGGPPPPPPPPPSGPRTGGLKSLPPPPPPFPSVTPSPPPPPPPAPKISTRNATAQHAPAPAPPAPMASAVSQDNISFPGASNLAAAPPAPVMSSPQPTSPAAVSPGPELPPSPALASQSSTDSLTSPEITADVPVTGKPMKDRLGKLNRFFQNKKPKPGRLLKGFRRGDAPAPAADDTAPAPIPVPEPVPAQPVESEEVKIKRERHAAQVADYEERLDEWNKDYKRKQIECELHNLTFDPSEFRPKPTAPAPFKEPSPTATVQGPLAPGLPHPKPQRVSSFRPIEQPVVAEGQKASELAEMFAAKAYGNGLHPAATPGHTTSVSSSAIFAPSSAPMIPAGADPTRAKPHAPKPSATPSMNAPLISGGMFQPPPPPAVAPHAAQHTVPNYDSSQSGYAPATQSRGLPMPQSNTYVDPQLAERIRRGRELTRLGIREEEGGNMGSAKEAYMKALELLIPAIPLLDHGNDVSYQFRMSEKQKLKREAALMLDRCEEIKRFLEQEVAALNTRNLLEQAPVPRMQPKKLSMLRQESSNYDDFGTPTDNRSTTDTTGGLGLAQKPVAKARDKSNVVAPPPPPPPPSHLLDGFSSLSLSDPLVQQSRPTHMAPAPMPPPLTREQLSGGLPKDSPANRQQMLSRPPDGSYPSPPAFPTTPPSDKPRR